MARFGRFARRATLPGAFRVRSHVARLTAVRPLERSERWELTAEFRGMDATTYTTTYTAHDFAAVRREVKRLRAQPQCVGLSGTVTRDGVTRTLDPWVRA